MDNETEKIIEEQIEKLPKEVVTFISSENWEASADEIGSLYNLSREELAAFKNELTLVLVGLTHPDEFSEVIEREVGIKGAVLEALVANVENKIFTQIRPALIEFFEREEATEAESQRLASEQVGASDTTEDEEEMIETSTAPIPVLVPSRAWEKTPDVAPDNLPTNKEVEPLMPPIPPKAPNLAIPSTAEGEVLAHPFEEKMKKVFTTGQQSTSDLTIEAATPQVSTPETQQVPKAPPIYHADLYRETIE